MIDLKINNLYIEPGTYGWTLHKKRMVKRKKTGQMEEEDEVLSYHGELLAAVREAWQVTQRDRLSEMRRLCEERFQSGPVWIAPFFRTEHYHEWAVPCYEIDGVFFSTGKGW